MPTRSTRIVQAAAALAVLWTAAYWLWPAAADSDRPELRLVTPPSAPRGAPELASSPTPDPAQIRHEQMHQVDPPAFEPPPIIRPRGDSRRTIEPEPRDPTEPDPSEADDRESWPIHVVRPNDTLGEIARRIYGSVTYADLIYEANRDVLPNRHTLRIDQTLRLPPHPSPQDRQGGDR